nr:putative O-antigen flippase [Vibrio metoecus]
MIRVVFSLSSLSLLGFGVGFLNQVIIANRFGVSQELDIYLVALSIVNMGWFFAGPISESTTPRFFEKKEQSLEKASRYFSSIVFNIFLFSILSSALIYIFLGDIYYSLDYGSSISYEYFKSICVSLLPIIFLSALNHYFQSVLNALGFFIGQSIGKIITALISMLFLIAYSSSLGVKAIVYGLEISLIIFLIFQYCIIVRSGIKFILSGRFILSVNLYLCILSLSATYLITASLPLLEKYTFSNFGEGFISSYNYAFLLMQVPLQVVSSGVIAVAWTNFMTLVKNDNRELALIELFKITFNVFIMMLFVAVFLHNYSLESIYIVFFSGEFGEESLYLTADMLSYLVLSLPFFIANTLLSRAIITILGVFKVVIANVITIAISVLVLYVSGQSNSYVLASLAPLISQFILLFYYVYFYFILFEKSRDFINLMFKCIPILLTVTIVLLTTENYLGFNITILKFDKIELIFELMKVGVLWFMLGIIIVFSSHKSLGRGRA